MKIRPAYQHTKLGQALFNLCAKGTEMFLKNPALYYILSCTWGILLTMLGLVLTVILWIISGIAPSVITFEKYDWIYCVKVSPDYWGGLEMGLMFLRDKKSDSNAINPHEFGHTFQNCIFGPLTPFIITIPSACRYWVRNINPKKSWSPYDSVWFEDAATQCGKFAHNVLTLHEKLKLN